MNGVAWVGNHLCYKVAKHIWLQRLDLRENDLLLLGKIVVLERSAKRRVWNVLAQGIQSVCQRCGIIQFFYRLFQTVIVPILQWYFILGRGGCFQEGFACTNACMMMIAFITIKSSLVPLIEGLCAQI